MAEAAHRISRAPPTLPNFMARLPFLTAAAPIVVRPKLGDPPPSLAAMPLRPYAGCLCWPWPSSSAQTAGHDFINLDDDDYVGDNPPVARGFTAQGIVWAFTHVHSNNWHPLTWLSHMLDCQLYGLKHPGGHHLTNVLLHAASAVVLFLVLRQMTGDLWPSAFVAALFAIHPLARRIGGLGGGTQGRAERTVLHADLGRLHGLRSASVFAFPLPAGDGPLCPGPDGQADARDIALCVAACWTIGRWEEGREQGARSREQRAGGVPGVPACGSRVGEQGAGTTGRRRGSRGG